MTSKENKDFKRMIKEIKKYKNATTFIEFAEPIPQEYRDKLIKNIAKETGKDIINKNIKFDPYIICQADIEKGVLPNSNIIQEATNKEISSAKLYSKKDSIKMLRNSLTKTISKKDIEKRLKKLNINLNKVKTKYDL